MKNVLMVLAMVAAIGFSGMALAKEKKEGKKAGLHGKITKIDGAKITVKAKDGTETVVVIDDNTKYTIDDKPAALADLKEGEIVAVTPETGTATVIAVHTTKKNKGGGAAAPSTAPAGDAK